MALIKKYPSVIESINNPFPGIYVLTFKSLEKPYKYLPGQFLHLALDKYDPSAAWPESRCFSMQSSDQDEFIRITYSVKGAFTTRMANELKTGKEIVLKLPYGELFSKPHSREKTVFIAGGTGVTPFLSLFTHTDFSSYVEPKLYLGVRDKNYHIYQKELDKASALNPGFQQNIVFQDSDGMLKIENIYRENQGSSAFFISGPPVMIKTFKKFLLEKGLSDDNIRTDDWE